MYAHYRFGKDVLKLLPADVKKDIRSYPDLYKIGLHGPDILFYYKPLIKNDVSALGHEMHEAPAMDFFAPALEKIRNDPEDHGERAYVYGFICHFILDSCCHGYIAEKIRESGVSHTRIEAEFESMLMRKDGIDPTSHHLTCHIHPTEHNAAVIARLIPYVSSEEVLKALRSTKFYSSLILVPGNIKRYIVTTVIKLIGASDSLGGMIIGRKPDPRCADSNKRLYGMYNDAIKEAAEYILQFKDLIENGGSLPDRYLRNFEA